MGKGSENPRDIWKFDPPVGRTDPDESAPGPPRVVTYRGANEKYKGRVLHLEKDDKGSRISVREKDDSINQKWFTTNGDSQNKFVALYTLTVVSTSHTLTILELTISQVL